jgi:hypothetical protein
VWAPKPPLTRRARPARGAQRARDASAPADASPAPLTAPPLPPAAPPLPRLQRPGFSEALARKLQLDRVLHGHAGCVNRLAWNEDGSMLASGSDDLRVGRGRAAWS